MLTLITEERIEEALEAAHRAKESVEAFDVQFPGPSLSPRLARVQELLRRLYDRAQLRYYFLHQTYWGAYFEQA